MDEVLLGLGSRGSIQAILRLRRRRGPPPLSPPEDSHTTPSCSVSSAADAALPIAAARAQRLSRASSAAHARPKHRSRTPSAAHARPLRRSRTSHPACAHTRLKPPSRPPIQPPNRPPHLLACSRLGHQQPTHSPHVGGAIGLILGRRLAGCPTARHSPRYTPLASAAADY